MVERLRTLPFDWIVPAALSLTVFLFACGSSGVPGVISIGHVARWIALAVLAGLTVAFAVVTRARPPVPMLALSALLVGLAFASTAWSGAPRVTFERAVTLAVALAVSAALGASASERIGVRILGGILCAAGTVALAGIVVYLADPSLAVEGSSLRDVRFRGLGQNPNTAPLLFSLAVPVGIWFIITGRARRTRLLGIATTLLLLASIIAADSRGAFAAALGSGLLVVLVGLRGRRLAVGLALVVAVVGVYAATFVARDTAVATRISLPGLRTVTVAAPPPSGPAASGTPVLVGPPLPADPLEIGRPRAGETPSGSYSDLSAGGRVGSSGRVQAWGGAIRQAARRPLLGYGFGTEDRVFVDRYYVFESSRAENSYIGIFLQLGIAGLLLFVGLIVVVGAGFLRLARRREPLTSTAVAFAGVVLAGLLLAIVQSYVYSIGNVAALTFWIGVYSLSAASWKASR